MKLLKDAPSINTHNGDPRKWPPGIYRSQMNPLRIVIVVKGSIDSPDERTVIAVTSDGARSPSIPLFDGYVPLPQGEIIRIEA